MRVYDFGDDVGEIVVRIGAIKFAGLDQRRDDCPMLSAAIRAGEQRVLSVQRNPTFEAFLSTLSFNTMPGPE
jgi:hypothetical protein